MQKFISFSFGWRGSSKKEQLTAWVSGPKDLMWVSMETERLWVDTHTLCFGATEEWNQYFVDLLIWSYRSITELLHALNIALSGQTKRFAVVFRCLSPSLPWHSCTMLTAHKAERRHICSWLVPCVYRGYRRRWESERQAKDKGSGVGNGPWVFWGMEFQELFLDL